VNYFEEQGEIENNKVDYNEMPSPREGMGFNAEAKRDQFLGGGGSPTKAPDASSSVILDRDKTIEERSSYRHELVERLVQLERDAIAKFDKKGTKLTIRIHQTGEEWTEIATSDDLMETANLEAFWNSERFTPPVDHSEEAQTVRNALAKSAWDEHEEWLATLTDEEQRILREGSEFDYKRHLISERFKNEPAEVWFAKFTDEEREIWRKASEFDGKCYPINQWFRNEHPEAWKIAIHIGMNRRDRFGNSLSEDKRWWQDVIAAAQKEAQKVKPKAEAESTDDKNVEPNEPSAEQVTDNFTVVDASGNNYQISLHGDLIASKLVEALKAKGAEALAAQVETLSKEQRDLPTLLTAAKIAVTPLLESPSFAERKKGN
jgi:hypothetical protein